MTDILFSLQAATPQGRTIAGLVVPWDTVGDPSIGRCRITPGAITTPSDLSRVKLLVDHDTSRPVGVATEATATDVGLHMSFSLPHGPAGDEALALAGNKLRDGLSVRVTLDQATTDDQGVTTVTAGALKEVSLVALPAYDDARVTTVTAARRSQHAKDHTMPDQPETETTETEQPEQIPQTGQERREVTASEQPAPPPAPRYATASTAPRAMTAAQALAAGSQMIAEGGSAAEVRSALSDIVPAQDAGQGIIREQWLGELWTADKVERPLIDSLTHSALTGLKAKGWRWTKRPEVDDWDGDKTEVPSNTIKTEPVEVTALRMAAAWDVDRAFIDLGDSGFLSALFTAAVSDWKRKTEAKAAVLLQSVATPVAGATNLTGTLAGMGAVAARTGFNLSMLFMAPDVWAGFISLTKDEVPWWLGGGDAISITGQTASINGMRVGVNEGLKAGTVIGGDRRAVTWFEQSGIPIRVQALDIAHGGVDIGVFGYYAAIVNDQRALLKSTVTKPTEPTEPGPGQ